MQTLFGFLKEDIDVFAAPNFSGDLFFLTSDLLPFIRFSWIVGQELPCQSLNKRPGIDPDEFCISTIDKALYNNSINYGNTSNVSFPASSGPPHAKGVFYTMAGGGYYRDFFYNFSMANSTNNYWLDTFEREIEPYFSTTTLMFTLQFNAYNPHTKFMMNEMVFVSYTAGGLYLTEYDSVVLNTRIFKM